jgi:predicted short-subunit dehydrogenase-like oxidoreductase (DUF2520 family)
MGTDISILGAGRLGTSLGRALAVKGHRIAALASRRLASARESRRIVGQGKPLTGLAEAAALGRIIIVSLPDDLLARTAVKLARSRVDWHGKIVLHTSGLLSSEVLKPLRNCGASVGSFHPAQSFAAKSTPPSRFRGAWFALEGDAAAFTAARALVRELGGRSVAVAAGRKRLYHTACAAASNYPVVLWQTAVELLEQAGLPAAAAQRLVVTLAKGTLRNVKKFDPARALTGPIVRGDIATVRGHLAALGRTSPRHLRVYREMGLAALEVAAGRDLAAGKIRALRRLLGGE